MRRRRPWTRKAPRATTRNRRSTGRPGGGAFGRGGEGTERLAGRGGDQLDEPRILAPHEVPVRRDRPAAGFRHVLRKRDVTAFLELLDDWEELGVGLEGVRLGGGEPDCFGWYEPGLVVVGAWPRTRTVLLDEAWVEESRPVLERLEVPIEALGGGRRRLSFDETSARGFLLLDVLLHELGHHHDRMQTRSQYECSNGEPYAMAFAERRTEELWERYLEVFG